MREILFRGKRTDYGTWVCGSLLCFKDGDMFICCEDYIPDIQNKYQVDPSTVGQYTGVPDKHGVKIFEGDIVESRASEVREEWKRWAVVWEDGGFEFVRDVSQRKKHKHEANTLCSDEIELYGLAVVGNIYDNPEMLKGGDRNG